MFGSNRFITIAGFSDIHKNDEGFVITELFPNLSKCTWELDLMVLMGPF